jgi:hypothetical protein
MLQKEIARLKDLIPTPVWTKGVDVDLTKLAGEKLFCKTEDSFTIFVDDVCQGCGTPYGWER